MSGANAWEVWNGDKRKVWTDALGRRWRRVLYEWFHCAGSVKIHAYREERKGTVNSPRRTACGRVLGKAHPEPTEYAYGVACGTCDMAVTRDGSLVEVFAD